MSALDWTDSAAPAIAAPERVPASKVPEIAASVSALPARAKDRRLALVLVALSTLAFIAVIPFARTPLPQVPAFIPAYEAALAINDLITAILLFGQFAELRRRALLALASGYLFSTLIAIPHALSFPGVFSATGLLGAGPQTTAWLYVLWHGGFGVFVLAYAILRTRDNGGALISRPGAAIVFAVLACATLATFLALLTTAGQDYLPIIMQGTDYTAQIRKGISPTVLAISFAALVILWRRRNPAVLDVWLMVVLVAWLYDVALASVVGSARFDLGFYAGRSYGLLAASFVLVVLVLETNGLHRRLAEAHAILEGQARVLEERVAERTSALQRANDTLTAEVAERKEAEGRLVQAQKMEAIGNLTGGMAHDFNNLLGVIIGNLDMLHELTKATPQSDQLVTESLDAALRGADLTKRLLAFARRQPLQPRSIDINEHVTAIGNLLKRTLGEQISITLALDAGVWPVMADPAQLEASIMNLATNARDAMQDGGQLTIRTANRTLDEDYAAGHADLRPGDYAMIEISDTGCGIPADRLNRIFEPFFTTKEQGKGTGLGLSMVFGFMKQSGGHINVYSEVGAGTTFRLYLPRTADGAGAEAEEAAAAPRAGNSETILVVEDNEPLRRIVVRQLVELGYRVLEAKDVRDALAVLSQQKIDLLFTDIVMPGGMTGFDLARMTRTHWPEVKLLFTSGFPDMRLASAGDLHVRLLSKPYRRDELGRTIREALDT
jgi:signal transduction histidine kinase